MSFRIFETEGFLKDLDQDFEGRQQKIIKKLRNHVYPLLVEEPRLGRNIRKLSAFTPDTWRYRIGAYRFFYQIDLQERIVFMVAAEHRQSAYKR